MKHVDLDLTVTCAGPHDSGAGRAANVPGGLEVGKHAPEEITIRVNSCGKALRPYAHRAGKARRLRRYPSQIPIWRPRASACGASRADRRKRPLRPRRRRAPAKKPREKVFGGGRGPQTKKVLDEPNNYRRYIYSTSALRGSGSRLRRGYT